MPRELFDGFGNKVIVYTGEEFAALVAQNVNLKREIVKLEKELKIIRSRKRKGLATE